MAVVASKLQCQCVFDFGQKLIMELFWAKAYKGDVSVLLCYGSKASVISLPFKTSRNSQRRKASAHLEDAPLFVVLRYCAPPLYV